MSLVSRLGSIPNWLKDGDTHPVAVSSRTRFARNLSTHTFPEYADSEEKAQIRREISTIIESMEFNDDWVRFNINEVTKRDKELLRERRLASQTLLKEDEAAIECSPDEDSSLLINEEDHLRINTLRSGLSLDESFQAASDIEQRLSGELPLASSSRWGYLTSCPTNLGTGMRVSVLLHIPGLVLSEKINRVLKAVSNLGLTVRGFYGEGSQTKGYYLQLSNQVTLGRSEQDILASLKKVTNQIVDREEDARQYLKKKSGKNFEDRIWKAFGTLRYARKIDREQSLQLLSLCRLGMAMDMLPSVPLGEIENLLVRIQPAHLQNEVDEQLSKADRNIFRATIIRRTLEEQLEEKLSDTDNKARDSQ